MGIFRDPSNLGAGPALSLSPVVTVLSWTVTGPGFEPGSRHLCVVDVF